jgi:prepilin-type N-terminal cleavage/methylation domain-containing protein
MLNHPPHRQASRASTRGARWGFTLVELMAVVVIIGIILAFILTAAMDSLRRAEERATQTLISKLENAINDRLDALLQSQVDPTAFPPSTSQSTFAPIYSSIYGFSFSPDRASVIAVYDYIKRELPDVFYVQNATPGSLGYPLNFAANPFLIPSDRNPNPAPLGEYVLPMGRGNLDSGEGIFGASYYAAAGIYKNLGYLPQGYDGVDNNANGLVDEWLEGVDSSNSAQVLANLAAHKHKTARSEVLYALLVEGSGPFGSVFSRDDFTDKEVKDTDGDGLPEFVDAWGEPLQFYRWPILYHSDLQRGQVITAASQQGLVLSEPYGAVWEEREQDPLDPNQLLLAPSWWSASNNDVFPAYFYASPIAAPGMSLPAQAFELYFHRISEPLQITAAGTAWDRSGNYRRAFYSKPLIISSGPDKALGLFQYSDAALQGLIASGSASGGGLIAATALIYNENSAMPYLFDYTANAYIPSGSGTITGPGSLDALNPNSFDLQQNGQDDISNHNLQTSVAGG